MKAILENKIREALAGLQGAGTLPAFDMPDIRVERPKDEQFGEYTASIALAIAKQAQKSPMEVAELLKEKLASLDFEKVEVVQPGHINFYLPSGYFQKVLASVLQEKYPAFPVSLKNEKVMVEYSQPNTHKEFHIGHLRNVFIGSTLVNVLRKTGDVVIAANYIGDTGTHIAKCLWGLVTFHSGENLEVISDKAEFLGKVYSEATQKIEENPEYEEAFKALQQKFEAGDPELAMLWEKTKGWSMDEFQKIYTELGVSFDEYFFESIEEEAGKKLLPELLEKGVVEKSDGAIIANLEKYDLGVLVLVRQDGSALYGLKDIPLAKKKFEQFGIDRSIYVVDIRQNLYLKQLFKILELYGFHEKMIHCGYEFVALKGGESMSSRKGNVIPARVLIDETITKVTSQFPESPDPEKIALGAIRFAMLKHGAGSRIEFDIEESVRLDGATGPYVQYAYARIASILAKAAEKNISFSGQPVQDRVLEEKEKDLIREIAKFSELLLEIRETYEVHKLAHYALRLADRFHSFYNECKVVDEENREVSGERLKLVFAAQKVLGEALGLMGIAAPEKM
ncbi:MAG: arginine--tRNA ligase [Candidatus Moranbacteria bacterium RIFCSPHIGHO2_01_FULL_54_31]|nr:MAG: arginine--tRNA ligase [Candidatus Moranbacteria bacterium RIFCSPHIGHO2_01_FULL_54_31]